MTNPNFPVTPMNKLSGDKLRNLRLWHWREAMHYRKRAKVWRQRGKSDMEREMDERANQHIKFVQTLNDFFPMGDTAEQDDAKR